MASGLYIRVITGNDFSLSGLVHRSVIPLEKTFQHHLEQAKAVGINPKEKKVIGV